MDVVVRVDSRSKRLDPFGPWRKQKGKRGKSLQNICVFFLQTPRSRRARSRVARCDA